MCYALANHDDEASSAPDEIVIDRFPNRHTAFGLGVHRCIGSNLACMSFKTMVTEALSRVPDDEVHLDGVTQYEDVGTINGFQHLPATFTPGKRQGDSLAETAARLGGTAER